MSNKLSEEYFQLVREALKDEKLESSPKRRKLRKQGRNREVPTEESFANVNVVHVDSEDEKPTSIECTPIYISDGDDDDNDSNNNNDNNTSYFESDEEYESDEFEDVIEPARGDINITIGKDNGKKPRSNKNIVTNDVRRFRRFYHRFHLVCLLLHGHIRNEWLNDPKLYKKLNKLVPDQVFEMLHPKKDENMPLRSTRKLLDGLKKCMDIWEKHFKVATTYRGKGLYMLDWDELDGPLEQCNSAITQETFNKVILKGRGPRDIGAQGFVAMLRACGVNARLVMSLQPPDFTNLKQSVNEEHVLEQKEQHIFEKNLASFKPGIDDPQTIKYPMPKLKKPMSLEERTYPIFWCEVWDKFTKKWITVDPMNLKIIEQVRNKSKLTPQGKSAKYNLMRYVIGFDRKGGCRDVTRRYTANLHSKVRKKRITKDEDGQIWYEKVLHKLHQRKRTKIDDFEDEYFAKRDETEGIPDSLQDLKNHPFYVLEKDLRTNEMLRLNSKECGFLRLRNKSTTMKVYNRRDVWTLKSARHWYMEGRVLKTGAKAAKTVTCKDFRTGETSEERLYPKEVTELFVPKPVGPNCEIPTNAYGNIDIYTSSMIPSGCCLIESPVAVKAAAFLGVEFAKAVTGFKFERHRIAKPQITGVVVACKYREAVETMIDGIEYSMEEEKRQDHELEALRYWGLFLAKLKIKQRLNSTHGRVVDDDTNSVREQHQKLDDDEASEVENSEDAHFAAGGFLPTDYSSRSQNQESNNNEESVPLNEEELTHSETELGNLDYDQEESNNGTLAEQDEEGGFIVDGSPEEQDDASAKENKPVHQNDADDIDGYENFMKDVLEGSEFEKDESDSEFIYESE